METQRKSKPVKSIKLRKLCIRPESVKNRAPLEREAVWGSLAKRRLLSEASDPGVWILMIKGEIYVCNTVLSFARVVKREESVSRLAYATGQNSAKPLIFDKTRVCQDGVDYFQARIRPQNLS